MAVVQRLEFLSDKRGPVSKKLIPKHRHIAAMCDQSNKSVNELLSDPFRGYPWLLMALLREEDSTISKGKCSDLIEEYVDSSDSDDPLNDFGMLLLTALQKYLSIEVTPTKDEEVNGERPPKDGKVTAAPSND